MTIKINGDNHSTSPGITSGDTDTGFVFGDDNLKLSIGGTQKIEVDASGNLGIGMTPSALSGYNSIQLASSTNGSYIDLYTGSNLDTRIICDASALKFQSDTKPVSFIVDGTERMRVANSGGISFNGDTADSNVLHDYEEGTWTPTVNQGTCSVISAAYTKVGRYVHAHCRINNFTGTSGGFHLTGLPYAIDNNACNDQHVGTAWGTYVGSSGEFHFWSQTSGLVTSAHAYAGGNGYAAVSYGSTITGNSNILVALHYISST
tara:strand:- start:464 stop:1249 length:786 start_codon:yes stop_codon:yes gene_type:complete